MRFNRSYPQQQTHRTPKVNWSNPITRGLVSLFPMGPEDLGARDIVKGTNTTRTGNVVLTSGRKGAFMQFDNNARIDFTAPLEVTSTTPVTFCWIQEGRNASSDSTVLNWKAPGATYSFLIYQHATGGSFYGFVVGKRQSNSGLEQVTFTNAVGTLTNFRVNVFVLTMANGMDSTSGVRLWRDGVEMIAGTTGTGNNFATDTSAVAKIGNISGNNIGFDGMLGNVGIFNRALTQAEAVSLSENIWQLYEPDRTIWLPTSAGGGPVTVLPTSIPSGEVFGSHSIALGSLLVAPTGIASGEAFGSHSIVLQNLLVSPSGISSGEAFGNHTIFRGTLTVLPGGISSGESFGTPLISVAGGTQTVVPSGIASAEAFGSHTILKGAIIVLPTGISSAEAFGNGNILRGTLVVYPNGIPSGESFGIPQVIGGTPVTQQTVFYVRGFSSFGFRRN